jgi:methionine-rich copper-binding protein CopC
MTLRLRTAAPLAALVAAIAVVWGGALAATPAEASSRLALMSSTPAAGSAFAHLPTEVVLRFNQLLVAGTVISVSAPDGEILASGPVAVHDDTAHMAIAGNGAAGTYTVAYTAADLEGRTTPGSYAFTVTTGSAPTGRPGKGRSATAAPPAAVPAQPVATAAASSAAVAGADTTAPAISSTPVWWTFAGTALVVACVLVVFIGFRRRTPARSAGQETPLTR